jgi:hypothetical protein
MHQTNYVHDIDVKCGPLAIRQGDRPDDLKNHWKGKHEAEGLVPVREKFKIYNADEIVEFILSGIMTVNEAAEYTCVLVQARVFELGKQCPRAATARGLPLPGLLAAYCTSDSACAICARSSTIPIPYHIGGP